MPTWKCTRTVPFSSSSGGEDEGDDGGYVRHDTVNVADVDWCTSRVEWLGSGGWG